MGEIFHEIHEIWIPSWLESSAVNIDPPLSHGVVLLRQVFRHEGPEALHHHLGGCETKRCEAISVRWGVATINENDDHGDWIN